MNIEVLHEVCNADGLCLQKGRWYWDDSPPSEGYRFIWRDDEGKLKPSRGQAYIPDRATMLDLIQRATSAGWLR